MNYAWSTVGFPALFLSQSFDSRNCSTGSFEVQSESEYVNSQAYGSLNIAGAGSDASLAIVFRRLIQFDGGKHFKAKDGFDPSALGNATAYQSVYLNDSIKWSYDPDDRVINGTSTNGTSTKRFNSLLFKVSVYEVYGIFPRG
jgi:hypothetical protein